MRKIVEILQLHFEWKLSGRLIAQTVSAALSTVQECLRRFAASDLSWPVDLDEAALEARLYPREPGAARVPQPDFGAVQTALASHKAMTRRHVWERYRAEHSDGLGYSAFCAQYAKFTGEQKLVLRQTHTPGEAMWVDYAGPSLFITDPITGQTRAVRVFVAVLGYSNYTFACATVGETTADWLSAQTLALEAFGGVPQRLVPDNPRALISKPCRYEPELNPSYQDFAQHYGIAVVPARVRKPRDKAKAETAVQIVERFLMPILLNERYFSLGDLNRAIAVLVAALNAKPFQKLDGSRLSRFEEERAVLRALPLQRYEYAAWKKAKVHLDYHVELDKHAYSVPHAFVGRAVDVRASGRTVEIFHAGKRLASHPRSLVKGGFTTTAEHRPTAHRSMVDTSLERLYRQAEVIGASTLAVLKAQVSRKKHPHETIRTALGILRLAKDYDAPVLEVACARALTLNTLSYRSVRNLIQCPPRTAAPEPPHRVHEHLRGADYFGAVSC